MGLFPDTSWKKHALLTPQCGLCKLDRGCKSPKMRVTGDGRAGVLIVAEAPGAEEDERGIQLVGTTGSYLEDTLQKIGVDMRRDCWLTNSLICRPQDSADPTDDQLEWCRPNLQNTIDELKPSTIIPLGVHAIKSLLTPIYRDEQGYAMARWAGWRIPCQQPNAWICPTYHPSYVIQQRDAYESARRALWPVLQSMWERHLAAAFASPSSPWLEPPNYATKVRIIYDDAEAANAVMKLLQVTCEDVPIAIDIETNMLKPDLDEARIVSCAVSSGEYGMTVSFPWLPAVRDAVRLLISSGKPFEAFNLKFEERWFRKEFGHGVNRWCNDKMLRAHWEDCGQGICGLGFQALVKLGQLPYYEHISQYLESGGGTREEQDSAGAAPGLAALWRIGCPTGGGPVSKHVLVGEANPTAGTRHTPYSTRRVPGSVQIMTPQPQTEEAYQLLQQGSEALAEVESSGIRIDTDYLQRTIRDVRHRISEMREQLKDTDFWATWKKRYGADANLQSHPQMGDILFNVMGFASKSKTATGRHKTDVESLEGVDHPFIKEWVRLSKLEKLDGTYLTGLQRETVNGYLHPSFNLHTVSTYRGSCSLPNFQNLPIRDGKIAALLRTAFIPRDGHLLVENDFKGIEVCGAAVYCKDPVLIDYIKDSKKDMHRDNAMRLFLIDNPKMVSKDARYVAKNQFTFPEFYGSYYIDVAQGLWQGMLEKNLQCGGLAMADWLYQRGVFELGDCNPKKPPRPGTFEEVVEDFEDWYWHRQYVIYSQWKKDWHASYLRTGGFSSLTGFYYEGLFERNQVLNYPIQGTAFHFLLWVMIRMVSWLKKKRMRSRVVGQIHDSLIGDVHESEKDEYLAKVKELVTVKLPEYWTWINVPLSVEAELTEVGGNWHQKKQIEL